MSSDSVGDFLNLDHGVASSMLARTIAARSSASWCCVRRAEDRFTLSMAALRLESCSMLSSLRFAWPTPQLARDAISNRPPRNAAADDSEILSSSRLAPCPRPSGARQHALEQRQEDDRVRKGVDLVEQNM